MSPADQPLLPINALIASLPATDRESVMRSCEYVDLPFAETVYKPGDAIRHVYFPTTSYISLISPSGAAESIEVGMVGNEGMFGITLLLGVKTSPLMGLVQGDGVALRMTASRFKRAANDSAAFRQRLHRYMYVLTAQIAQTAACNRFHTLDARLARWLLMTQDRAQSSTFRLTHAFLAYMLGVRRVGITEAAGRLQAKRFIRYSHGQLTVLDRNGLEKSACACYDAHRKLYVAYLGNRKKSARTGSRRTGAK